MLRISQDPYYVGLIMLIFMFNIIRTLTCPTSDDNNYSDDYSYDYIPPTLPDISVNSSQKCSKSKIGEIFIKTNHPKTDILIDFKQKSNEELLVPLAIFFAIQEVQHNSPFTTDHKKFISTMINFVEKVSNYTLFYRPRNQRAELAKERLERRLNVEVLEEEVHGENEDGPGVMETFEEKSQKDNLIIGEIQVKNMKKFEFHELDFLDEEIYQKSFLFENASVHQMLNEFSLKPEFVVNRLKILQIDIQDIFSKKRKNKEDFEITPFNNFGASCVRIDFDGLYQNEPGVNQGIELEFQLPKPYSLPGEIAGYPRRYRKLNKNRFTKAKLLLF